MATHLGNTAQGPTLKINADGTIGFSGKSIAEKDGKKYLRVEGGKLGIPLESLE